jgi:hypothetical protein
MSTPRFMHIHAPTPIAPGEKLVQQGFD